MSPHLTPRQARGRDRRFPCHQTRQSDLFTLSRTPRRRPGETPSMREATSGSVRFGACDGGEHREAGRTGLASQTHAGKASGNEKNSCRKGLDDEMIVLGT